VRFAVNVDPREGDLRRTEGTQAALSAFFPGVTLEIEEIDAETSPAAGDEEEGEFWRALATAVLAFLLVESGLGLWVRYRRR
jgi:hypothetical protein